MAQGVPASRRRPVRRSSITPALSPGDTIDFSLTGAMKHPRHGEWWIKCGGTTQIREDETAEAAKERLSKFVIAMLDEKAQEILT